MNFLPVMDSRNIDRDGNGVVYIKPMPILAYVMGGIMALFAVGFLVKGQIVEALILIGGVIYNFIRSKNVVTSSSVEFNPNTRIFKFGSDPNATTISFDEIAGFGKSTEKEAGDFTKERILVILKDSRAVEIGMITDANEKKREEKVANMLKFLYETTGIVLSMNGDNELEVEKSRKEYPELLSSDEPAEESSDSSASTNSLEKFTTQINQLTLNESAEDYYIKGEALMAKNEFDDAILEYVKAIRVSSPQEKWYMSAKKGLKGLGFSESDIRQV